MDQPQQHHSDLLRPLIRGELDDPTAAKVHEHLAGCPPCAEELAGVQLLVEGPEATPLNDLERARLHAGVTSALSPAASPLTTRLAPYMGAAAALLLIAVGIVALDLGTGDDQQATQTQLDSPGGDALEESGEGPDSFGQGAGGGSMNAAVEDEVNGQAKGESTVGAIAAAQDAGGRSADLPEGTSVAFYSNMERDELSDLSANGNLFHALRGYSSGDAERFATSSLEQLVAGRSREEAGLIRSCVARILARKEANAVPAYGGFTRLAGHKVLFLGFIVEDPSDGKLSRYVVWAWPKTGCDEPVAYRLGRVGP